MILRDYQADHRGVEGIRSAFRGGARRVLYVAPCGAGKTHLFAFMTQAAALKGRRVLLLAHRIELVEQISETLTAFGVPHSRITAWAALCEERVWVGMIGTVANRLARLEAPDFIVVDEAHHATSMTYRKIIDNFASAHVLGVTASPGRTDGRGLGEIFEVMVVGPSVNDLTAAGHLTPYRLFCPPVELDLAGIRTLGGDYARNQLAERLDRPEITGNAVATYRKHADSLPFVAFCVSRAHAAHVAERFLGAGIPTRNIDGSMAAGERSEILASLRSGRLLGVTSVDLIGEGFDLPAITAAIMLRPTKSLIVYTQHNGRAFRPAPGKKCAIILDHAGNALRFGMPDRDREWSLEGRSKENGRAKSTIEIRHCRECFLVYPAGEDRCPHCGAAARDKSRKLEERDGELIEITADMELESVMRRLSFGEAISQCKTPDDIRMVAKAKGYRPGWAIRQTMAQFKVSPFQAAKMLGYKTAAGAMITRRRAS